MLPSQFLENWCWEAEALSFISGHYQTGEPLPEELLKKLGAARNFQSGMAMVRQLEFALFDFRLHADWGSKTITSVQGLLDEVRKVAADGYRTLVTTLTKRMSEDLTEYMHEQGIRVRYMHSDIDTIERIEILRDLRLGAFDVLIGINLLREGLDIPECGLVAILDADKEGFLRSETSLVQTIGRAARNAEGRVIMYADRITGSMERAMGETDRRRAKQEAYNIEHGITPTTVKKNVEDVLAGLWQGDTDQSRVTAKVDQPMVGANLAAHLEALRAGMRKAAENLEFEEAARLRDEVKRLEAVELTIADDPLARQAAVDAAVGDAVKSRGRSTGGKAGSRARKTNKR